MSKRSSHGTGAVVVPGDLAMTAGLTRNCSSSWGSTADFHEHLTEGEEKSYGGCEGPDASYVKLVSSDGLEFTVETEHELISGTIKASFCGLDGFAENKTNKVSFIDSSNHTIKSMHLIYLQPAPPTFLNSLLQQTTPELLRAENFLDY